MDSADLARAVFITNELGDVVEVDLDGVRHSVNPSEWRWLNEGGKNDLVEQRRSMNALLAIPGFAITKREQIEPFKPGPRPERTPGWLKWRPGAAPPAALESKGGVNGTLAYYNRLSEAVGNTATRLPINPERNPMVLWDFVVGWRYEVVYTPQPMNLSGRGTVYLLDDGFGIKIGFTSGPVAKRISELQTGNPRRIITIAEITNIAESAEELLQESVAEWNVSGEWYDRGRIVLAVAEAGGFESWLKGLLGDGDWSLRVHPPYR